MGGIETHLQALCGALRSHADVRVIVSSENRNTVEEMVDAVPVARLSALLTAFSTSISPGWFPVFAIPEPDWYTSICQIPPPSWRIWRAAASGPLVVTYHSDTVKQEGSRPDV